MKNETRTLKIKKMTSCSIILLLMFSILMSVNTFATSASDYQALKFGKVEDSGKDTVILSGKGFIGTTTTQGPDYTSAILYKNPVDPRNFKCTLTFVNDYGQGEGSQSGWYAINFSKTLNWFSPVKTVIQKAAISGVTIIFKLNPNNKKELLIELSRYSPGSGFVNIFGSTITKTIKSDWVCNLNIANGILMVDDSQVLDLSDALDLAIGSGQKGYVGYGGFSENHYEIKMKIAFAGTVIPTNPASSGSSGNLSSTIISSNASSTGNSSVISKASADSSSASAASQGISSGSSDSSLSGVTSDVSGDSSVAAGELSDESDSNRKSEISNTNSQPAKKDSDNTGIILAVVAVIVIAGAGTAFFLMKNRNKR